jgi:hypothetical protein
MATPPVLLFTASGQTQNSPQNQPVVNVAFGPPLGPLQPGQTLQITLVVQDQNGNSSQPLTKTLKVQAPPSAGFTTTPANAVIPNQQIKLDPSLSGPAGVPLTFVWTIKAVTP